MLLRALRGALGRGTLGGLRLLLFLDALLTFTLLVCILHVGRVVLRRRLSGTLRRRYVLVKKCGALSSVLRTVLCMLRAAGVSGIGGAAVNWVEMATVLNGMVAGRLSLAIYLLHMSLC